MELYQIEYDSSVENFNRLKEIGIELKSKLPNISFIEIANQFDKTRRGECTGLIFNFDKKMTKKSMTSYMNNCIVTLVAMKVENFELTISERWFPNQLVLHLGVLGFPYSLIKDPKYKEYVKYCESLKTIIK
jgi:hypothetical protein